MWSSVSLFETTERRQLLTRGSTRRGAWNRIKPQHRSSRDAGSDYLTLHEVTVKRDRAQKEKTRRGQVIHVIFSRGISSISSVYSQPQRTPTTTVNKLGERKPSEVKDTKLKKYPFQPRTP